MKAETYKLTTQDNLRAYLREKEKGMKKIILNYFKSLKEALSPHVKRIFEEKRIPQGLADTWTRITVFFIEEKVMIELKKAIEAAGKNFERKIRERKEFSFHITSEISEWTENHAGELISMITSKQLEAIRRALTEHVLSQATSVQELEEILKPLIGLLPRETQAVTKMAQNLLSEGISKKLIAKKIKDYSNYLLSLRAERIARTELTRAYEYGAWQAIVQARDSGFIQGDIRKRWITAQDERLCIFCSEMDGMERGLDEDFNPGIPYPPLHPACRCDIVYETPGR